MKRPEKEDYFKNWTQNINLLHQDKDRYIESLEKYIDYLEQQEVGEEEIENEAEKIFNIQDPQQFLGFMKGAKWMQSKLKGNG